ncbi:thiolase family protein [Ascoidea rubescens DSM 1968]|uniref:Thiolase n=1 Tax=Ascoidea rubescens DSM 1968 TaxID=1344418 RepID=A0A1D2VK40_9ASCO|nr:thiolase [Ascoidea rubescens DSM 1968]ODV61968.1 thiolase [Ascoidea rubescens DSM 1968]
MSFLIKQVVNKSPKDIVVLAAVRSPVTRAKKGGLAHMYPEELLYQVVKGGLEKAKVDPKHVDEVTVGTVLQTLGGQKNSAVAIKSIGFPVSTTINTVNRQCSSSAQAVTYTANSIRSEDYGFGIAAGVESMTFDYFPHRGIPTRTSQSLLNNIANDEARNVLMPMGITSENVAKKYGISRKDQDEFAFNSHQKAAKATESGHFLKEIIPIKARSTEEGELDVEIIKDDGIRANISIEKLNSLKPAFTEDGFTTAGNASQISDGASCVILTTREKAEELSLKPIARYISASVAGVPSDLMGVGPAFAVPQLLKKLQLESKDIDVWELNEAFASQSLYVVNQLGINIKKVNPHGGAIALGHPLGATGARCIATLLNGLDAANGELGVVSMCTSTGQGYAGLFVKE